MVSFKNAAIATTSILLLTSANAGKLLPKVFKTAGQVVQGVSGMSGLSGRDELSAGHVFRRQVAPHIPGCIKATGPGKPQPKIDSSNPEVIVISGLPPICFIEAEALKKTIAPGHGDLIIDQNKGTITLKAFSDKDEAGYIDAFDGTGSLAPAANAKPATGKPATGKPAPAKPAQVKSAGPKN